MAKTLCITVVAFVVLGLGFNAYAASCNKKAEVHQRRAQNLKMQVQMGYIPTTEEEDFVVCMFEEKEDKTDFRQRVQGLKNQQRAAQEREAAQRRQAEIERNKPASAAELANQKAQCESLARGYQDRDAFLAFCYNTWKANPHSRCGGDNLPCGNACFTPGSGQACINNIVTCTPEGQRALLCSPTAAQLAVQAPAAPQLYAPVFFQKGKSQADADRDENACRMARIRGDRRDGNECMKSKGWEVRAGALMGK